MSPLKSSSADHDQKAVGKPFALLRRPQGAADLLKAAFLAILFTAVFYEVFPLPLIDKASLLALFQNRVSAVILGFTLCSLFLLGFKYQRFRQENRLQKQLLSAKTQEIFRMGIQPWQAQEILQRLQQQQRRQKKLLRSTAWRLIERLLLHQPSVTNKESLTAFMASQAELELKKLELSYAALRVFIWAIPILGFIGTVLGIGEAVGQFAVFIENSGDSSSLGDEMRSALGGVTGGLAIAFNTTFLALVLVVPVMMLSSFLQKNEEELLIELEEYCLEHILPHLQVSSSIPVDENYQAHLRQLTQLSQTWVSELNPLVKNLSTQTETIHHQLTGLQPLVRQFTERLLKQNAPKKAAGTPSKSADSAPQTTAAKVAASETSPSKPSPSKPSPSKTSPSKPHEDE